MQFDIPHHQFAAKQENDTRLVEVTAIALSSGASLVLSVEPDYYRISVGKQLQPLDKLTLTGCWMSEYLRAASVTNRDMVLLPYAFLLRRVELSPTSIFTLGRPYRSVADFFMRNFYTTALCGRAIAVLEYSGTLDSKTLRGAQNLIKTYTWALKSARPEPILERRDGPELILAGLHADLICFESHLLQAALNRTRQRVLDNSGKVEGFQQFERVRQRVLAAMGIV